MSLNKEQKADVVKELSRIFGRVRMQIDGYEFVAETRLHKRTLVIQWFCNGAFKGAWLLNDCEERRRFCPTSVHRVYKKKDADKLKKTLGKKLCAELSVDKEYVGYGYAWRSPAKMVRHLLANNKSIELITEDENT